MEFKLKIRRSKIDGRGLFALSSIARRKKIGELHGEIITIRKGREIVKLKKRIALVELDGQYALNATNHECELKYVNHSCTPNTFMRIIRHHVEFYSLKEINKGEELTCNYGETHHEGKMKCRCKSKNCKGYL